MQKFGDRLRNLRVEQGISQVKLAEEIKAGQSAVSLWELTQRELTLSKLVALARYFDVTLDYLAGLED